MNQSIVIACVAAGGAIGSVLRLVIGQWMLARIGPGYPWGTFVINVFGAFCIGAVLQASAIRADFNPYLRLFLATGVLGGFTTFSTFAYEITTLGSGGPVWQSLAYAVTSVACGAAAVLAGMLVVR